MYYKYPILDKTSATRELPTEIVCPICGADYRDTGWMWLTAGAQQLDENGDGVYDDRCVPLAASFDIGFHGKPMPFPAESDDQEEEEYLSLDIVQFLSYEDFTFTFCSIECLREWINRVLSDFETLFEKKYKRKLSKPHDGMQVEK